MMVSPRGAQISRPRPRRPNGRRAFRKPYRKPLRIRTGYGEYRSEMQQCLDDNPSENRNGGFTVNEKKQTDQPTCPDSGVTHID